MCFYKALHIQLTTWTELEMVPSPHPNLPWKKSRSSHFKILSTVSAWPTRMSSFYSQGWTYRLSESAKDCKGIYTYILYIYYVCFLLCSQSLTHPFHKSDRWLSALLALDFLHRIHVVCLTINLLPSFKALTKAINKQDYSAGVLWWHRAGIGQTIEMQINWIDRNNWAILIVLLYEHFSIDYFPGKTNPAHGKTNQITQDFNWSSIGPDKLPTNRIDYQESSASSLTVFNLRLQNHIWTLSFPSQIKPITNCRVTV